MKNMVWKTMVAAGLALFAQAGGAATLAAGGAQPVSENIAGRENCEWSIAYGWHFNDRLNTLPRALFVGDSITVQYNNAVGEALTGKMNATVWGSSYCITRPIFRQILATYLDDHQYDVVHLSSGGHSFRTETAAWKAALKDICREIREKQPNAKIVWTTYTPVKDPKANARIAEFNAAAAEVVEELKLDGVDDQHALVSAIKDPWADGVHLKAEVRQLQAKQAAESCLRVCGRWTLPSDGKVRLSMAGKPLVQIVVADKPTRAAQFGAADLRWHLKKITGADFEIVPASKAAGGLKICVGESACTKTKASDLVGQQHVVDIRADAIELVGRDAADYRAASLEEKDGVVRTKGIPGHYDEQGSMYAVYEFLERDCGVTWVDATDCGTVVPKRPELALETGRRVCEPYMAYRGGAIDYAPAAMLWKGGSAGGKAYLAAAFKDPQNARAAYDLFFARSRAGGENATANHSFYWWYDRYWNEGGKRFIEKRPECFAKGYAGLPPQMCYLNPKTIAQTVEDIRAYLDHGGYTNTYRGIAAPGPTWGRNRYCLEPMDDANFCKCELCAPCYEPAREKEKSQHSTYWFTFVKKVAEQIKVSHPTAKISTLAYFSHEGLPTGVTLPDNVEVYFCISGNRENPRGELCKAQCARMREWHEAYPDMKLGLWLYSGFPLEFAHAGNFQCVPGYFAHENAKQFRLFKEMNAQVGIFNCGLSGEVCQFMTFALMRDPDLDANALLDRFFAQYGAAAKPLRAFYDLVEARFCDPANCPKGVSRRSTGFNWKHCCPPEVMAKLARCMEEAKRLARTPDEKARVRLFELGQWNWMKYGSDTYVERMRAPMPAWTAVRVASADGDVAKVDWESVPCVKAPIYERGGTKERADVLAFETRLAHDGKWFYLELVQKRDLSKLEISGSICPYDDWELYVARQRAQPYRCYFADAADRLLGASWGEVNWRSNVESIESCKDKAYFARTKSIVDKANNRWVQRFAFPLDRFLDGPIQPGETFYLNPVTVLNPRIAKCDSHLFVFTPVTHATVHTIDRSAAVTLEK